MFGPVAQLSPYCCFWPRCSAELALNRYKGNLAQCWVPVGRPWAQGTHLLACPRCVTVDQVWGPVKKSSWLELHKLPDYLVLLMHQLRCSSVQFKVKGKFEFHLRARTVSHYFSLRPQRAEWRFITPQPHHLSCGLQYHKSPRIHIKYIASA